MKSNPFFSICIPCYNHAAFIGKTLESVLAQDFKDFEIIVSNNASTDNSKEIVRSFKDSRIRLIENRWNIGFAPNLQQVTRHAQGAFFNLLSSDDLMNPGALSTYANLIQQHSERKDDLVLMSQVWDIDEYGKIIGYRCKSKTAFEPVRVKVPSQEEIQAQPLSETYEGFMLFTHAMKRFNTVGAFCSMVYSKELWNRVEGYNSTQLISPDMHFIHKVLKLDPLVVYVNRPLYSYRTHSMGQAAQQRRNATLRFQADQYNYLMHYNENWLQGVGITTAYQRQLFVERDCIRIALSILRKGNWTFSSRLLAFAWAAYPDITVRNFKAWILFFLLLSGPLGIAVLWLVFKLIHRPSLPSIGEVAGQTKL